MNRGHRPAVAGGVAKKELLVSDARAAAGLSAGTMRAGCRAGGEANKELLVSDARAAAGLSAGTMRAGCRAGGEANKELP